MVNKKGQMWPVVILLAGLVFLLIVAVAGMIGWSVLKTATDDIIPEIRTIGEVQEGTNVSEYADIGLVPAESIIDNLGLFIGIIYILGVGGLLSLSFIFRNNRNGWVIALFVASSILVILITILISNAYEEFYLGQDDIGANLRSESLASFLIIHSPKILTFVIFVAGIILFTGEEEGRYYV